MMQRKAKIFDLTCFDLDSVADNGATLAAADTSISALMHFRSKLVSVEGTEEERMIVGQDLH